MSGKLLKVPGGWCRINTSDVASKALIQPHTYLLCKAARLACNFRIKGYFEFVDTELHLGRARMT